MERLWRDQRALGKPVRFKDSVRSPNAPLAVGDLVRSKNRQQPGRAVYWVTAIRADGEPTIKILTTPDGSPVGNGRHVPGKWSNLEATPLRDTPAWLVKRALQVPPGIAEVAKRGPRNHTIAQIAQSTVREQHDGGEATDPIEQLDRVQLRQACMDCHKSRSDTMRMTPMQMRAYLHSVGFVPPETWAVGTKRRVATTAFAQARKRVRQLHPIAHEHLATEDLLELAKPLEDMDSALRAVQALSEELQAHAGAGAEAEEERDALRTRVNGLEQELETTRKDLGAEAAKLQDALLEKSQIEVRLSAAEKRLRDAEQGAIPRTRDNEEALELGLKVLEQRKAAANPAGGRFGMLQKKGG